MDLIRRAVRATQRQDILSFEGQTQTHTIDYSPWADDNGTVTDVTLTVKSGSATIANESLTSNVKTFTVTTTNAGSSLIEAKATAGNNIDIYYLRIYAWIF